MSAWSRLFGGAAGSQSGPAETQEKHPSVALNQLRDARQHPNVEQPFVVAETLPMVFEDSSDNSLGLSPSPNSSQLTLAAFVNDAQIQLKFLSESNLDFVPARKSITESRTDFLLTVREEK